MKKTIGFALSLAMILGLFIVPGGSAFAAEKKTTLLVASMATEAHPYGKAMMWMRDWLRENSKTLDAELHLGGVLGGDRELAEQAVMGNIDMNILADMSWSPYAPGIIFANFPGLFKDYDDVRNKYWNGWVGEEVKKMARESGIEILAFVDNGFRWMTNSKRPIAKVADLKGLKMRVPELDFLIDLFNALDTVVTPIAFGEIATALQQKVVDGQENGLSSIYPFGFHEFNKFMTESNHCYSSGTFHINLEKWKSLTPQQQADLKAACKYAAEKQIAFNMQFYKEKTKELIDVHGVTFTEPDPSFLPELVNIGKKMANSEKYKKIFGAELVKKMYP